MKILTCNLKITNRWMTPATKHKTVLFLINQTIIIIEGLINLTVMCEGGYLDT